MYSQTRTCLLNNTYFVFSLNPNHNQGRQGWLLSHLMGKETEAQKGDLGLQAGPDTPLCFWGIWGLFYGRPLSWVPLSRASPLPFALCPTFPLFAERWSCFLCNSMYGNLRHLPADREGQGVWLALYPRDDPSPGHMPVPWEGLGVAPEPGSWVLPADRLRHGVRGADELCPPGSPRCQHPGWRESRVQSG